MLPESSIVSFAYNLSIYSSKIGSYTYVLFIYTKKDAEFLPRPYIYLALSSLTFDTSLCATSCFTSSTSLAFKCICIILILLRFSNHWRVYKLCFHSLNFCPLRLCLFLLLRILHAFLLIKLHIHSQII